MPRLSEPMKAALEAAERYGCLALFCGRWGNPSGAAPWFRNPTIVALAERGLLRESDYLLVVITPAGREAIGMKEGEDYG